MRLLAVPICGAPTAAARQNFDLLLRQTDVTAPGGCASASNTIWIGNVETLSN